MISRSRRNKEGNQKVPVIKGNETHPIRTYGIQNRQSKEESL
jgi:hypothetical protein